MKCLTALTVLLAASAAQAQSLKYLATLHQLSISSTNTHTATAWEAFYSPVGVRSSGIEATSSLMPLLQFLHAADAARLDFGIAPLEYTLAWPQDALHDLDASDKLSSRASNLQFSLRSIDQRSQ